MAVQVAVGADVDEQVEGKGAAAELAQQFVPARARAQGDVEHFGLAGGAPGGDALIEVGKGGLCDAVEQGGGDFGQGLGGVSELDRLGGAGRERAQILGGPDLQVGTGLGRVGVGFDVAGERRGHGFGDGNDGAGGRFGTGLGGFGAELAYLFVSRGAQAADLLLEGPDAGDLADASGNAEQQQVAGDVEGAGGDVALVGVGLHRLRPRKRGGEVFHHAGVNRAIGGEQGRGGAFVVGGLGGVEPRGADEARTGEVLVAAGAGLAVPQGLVFELDGGNLADALEAEREVAQVGYGGVAVLEIEVLHELAGVVGKHPAEGLLKRGPASGCSGPGRRPDVQGPGARRR